jgi:GABA permease
MARRNPFRSEAEAFRLVWVTIAAFAAIAAATLLGGWAVGLAVAVAVIALGLWWYLKPLEESSEQQASTHVSGEGERRILVIANETVAGEELREAIERAASGYDAHVLVVIPAVNTKLRHWVSDEDAARAAARERLANSLARLAASGIDARGEVGDADPVQSIADGLRTFGADEVIISTHPEGRSNWLVEGVVDTARERFAVPITHVVVDLEREPAA